MAANNLRILYNNVADTATITSTETAIGFQETNLQSDIKGLVWRSSSQVAATITLTWAIDQTISAVILPLTNLSTSATIRVVCKTASSSTVYDSTTITAIPYSVQSSTLSQYSYGGGATARVYLPTTLSNVRSIAITLIDVGNTQGFMEVSRIICGTYWSPTYNTEFGLSVEYRDQSQHSRAQAGNLITDISYMYKVLTFTLGYMNYVDRNTLVGLLRQNGMRQSIWVSLFPSDADPEKEYIYSIFGKLSQNVTITHPMYSQYVSSITIEEV